MANYIWGDLDRAVNDGTKIDQAIEVAIAAHNDDPESHLGADQSLQSHRAAEIIDHLAESVVNDKIKSVARAYVAIVGSGVAGDFDTVQAAIAYAASVGGGTVLLMPGTYYISGVVNMPLSVNIAGLDAETTTLHGAYDDGNYLRVIEDPINHQRRCNINNLTIASDGGAVFYSDIDDVDDPGYFFFDDCVLTGGDTVFHGQLLIPEFESCRFYAGNNALIEFFDTLRISNCTGARYGTSSAPQLSGCIGVSLYYAQVFVQNSVIDFSAASGYGGLCENGSPEITLINSKFYNMDAAGEDWLFNSVIGCVIAFHMSYERSLYNDGNEGWIIGNRLYCTTSTVFTIGGSMLIFVANYISIPNSKIDKTLNVYAPPDVGAYLVQQPGYANIDLDTMEVMQQTPNSTRTYTSNVPRAGSRRTLIILTSGAVSYTLTFGTGFKTTGTLVTGTTTGRRHIINFVSDGTYLIETGRIMNIA